jgi:isopenicillin N synthase-like dioxygenase
VFAHRIRSHSRATFNAELRNIIQNAISNTSNDALVLPVIDLQEALSSPTKKASILTSIQQACKSRGFFIIINHFNPPSLQEKKVLTSKALLQPVAAVDESLPGRRHRAYQRIGGEGNEPGKLPDLKEVCIFQRPRHLNAMGLKDERAFNTDEDQLVSSRMLTGTNIWPTNEIPFREMLEEHFQEVRNLAIIIFTLIAESFGLDFETSFGDFCTMKHQPFGSCIIRRKQLTGMRNNWVLVHIQTINCHT